MTVRKSVLATLCLLLFTCSSVCWGQSDTGTPNEEVMVPINPYESVNAGSGNILLTAPIRSKGGPIPFRGTISENVQIYANGSGYRGTLCSARIGCYRTNSGSTETLYVASDHTSNAEEVDEAPLRLLKELRNQKIC